MLLKGLVTFGEFVEFNPRLSFGLQIMLVSNLHFAMRCSMQSSPVYFILLEIMFSQSPFFTSVASDAAWTDAAGQGWV